MKTLYWTSTIVLAAMLLLSSWSYLFHGRTIEGVRELGFPDPFRIQLAVLKLLAAIVILVPAMPLQAKEWAYAGIALFLLTAIVAHLAHRDPWSLFWINLGLLAIVATSNVTLHRLAG